MAEDVAGDEQSGAPRAGLVLAADFKTFLDKILANTYECDTEGRY